MTVTAFDTRALSTVKSESYEVFRKPTAFSVIAPSGFVAITEISSFEQVAKKMTVEVPDPVRKLFAVAVTTEISSEHLGKQFIGDAEAVNRFVGRQSHPVDQGSDGLTFIGRFVSNGNLPGFSSDRISIIFADAFVDRTFTHKPACQLEPIDHSVGVRNPFSLLSWIFDVIPLGIVDIRDSEAVTFFGERKRGPSGSAAERSATW